MPASTNAPSAAGMVKSINSPRIALKTSGGCIRSRHRLTLLNEVLNEPQDAGHADETAGRQCRRQPAATAPPLQHCRNHRDTSTNRADHVADPVDGIQECALRLRSSLALDGLAGCWGCAKVLRHTRCGCNQCRADEQYES